MATHISARLAWHMNGWNGKICRNPSTNHYCIGPRSYPGDKIKGKRDLVWEEKVAGQDCSRIDGIPPCIYSINTFGRETLTAFDDPPDFFSSGFRTQWVLPPATVCVWPYEAMYSEDVKTGGRVDNAKRLIRAKEFFAAIEPDKSLVFHYANYSNPLSEEDTPHYVVVGLSRIKKLGKIEFYEGTDQATRERYGGAFVWQMNVETHYPDQGLCIPYHRYLDNPEVLDKITIVPENSRNFKYGSRQMTDDDALSLIERFIQVVTFLRDSGDDSENWALRLEQLNGLLGELWSNRGLYPGLACVLDLVGLSTIIATFRTAVARGEEKAFRNVVFLWLDEKEDNLPGIEIKETETARIRRRWKLKTEEERQFLREFLPRFDLSKEQMERILSEKRSENCLEAGLKEISVNPYLLAEQFIGDNPDDIIPFSRIDHGVFPSPELGGEFIYDVDDWRRLRVLCVDRLRFETKHTFLSCGQLLQDVNRRLSFLPEWKVIEFTERYFEVDREHLEEAIVFRKEGEREYAYLRQVYQSEREIEERIRSMAVSADIGYQSPVMEKYWYDLLFEPQSILAAKCRKEYEKAIEGQTETCAKIFKRSVSVVCGAAGTGKTTVIRAILQAIEKAHGIGVSFLLLAPTGKAADRIREKTGKPAGTIHSFLAKLGWLNQNLTIKQHGGRKEESITTYVIDEASMLNLELMAALFRAINWNTVQRLIIVGDPNQLPPIGRGKVFADIIDWLWKNYPNSVGELMVNLRQMENKVSGNGTGIIDLASLYTRFPKTERKDEEASLRAEEMFRRLQDFPPDGTVDKDLRVLFWKDSNDLLDKLVRCIVDDFQKDSGMAIDPKSPQKLWQEAVKSKEGKLRPDYYQVISPYLHEEFGTEAINIRLQSEAQTGSLNRIGTLDGITVSDKVIQIRNRAGSNPIFAWNLLKKANEQCEIFNGELGYVLPHLFDMKFWHQNRFRLKRFCVRFSRKDDFLVCYGSDLGRYTKAGRTRDLPGEDPEDNLELAYAISVHKSQGSEFERIYFVLPKQKTALLSPELFYTGLTRATRHCTLLVESDIAPLLKIHRPQASHLVGINCSLFDFTPAPEGFELLRREGYFEEGKVHRTLAENMVRSKSEVIIANILFDREISFEYEKPLYAPDGSFYLPDFTILWHGEQFFWEHLGLLVREEYKRKWAVKKGWYEKNFPGRLIITEESGNLSNDAQRIIKERFH